MALLSHIVLCTVLTKILQGARLCAQMSESKRHACEARFLIMLELTTGVAFLVSSLYGSGNPINTAQARVTNAIDEVIASETRTFTDSKEVEDYLRTEYADTPILIDIARCESQFRQYNSDGIILRGRVNSADVGVMQINEKYHGKTADNMEIDIYKIEGNVAFAKYLYGKYGAQPWSASAPCWSKSNELAKN